MKSILKSGLAAACLLGISATVAAPAQAQLLEVNPRVGLYAPLTDLGEAGSTASTIVADRAGSLALGLGVELGFLPLPIRANLDYVTGAEVSEEGVGEPTEAKMLAVSADLMIRPLPRIIIIQPYLFAGAGLRSYSFDPAAGAVSQLEDANDPTVHLGGGADLSLGPLHLNAEIGDYISWYEIQADETEMQHDLFVSIGLVLGIL
jgi:hypothetical protein